MLAYYWPRTCYFCPIRPASQPMYYRCEYTYIDATVSIHNSIYLFNIKLDGHYRSWIEYLNERY